MKLAIAIILGLAFASPASAKDITLKLNDEAQSNVSNLPTYLDQCIANIMMHGDPATCRNISTFFANLGNLVHQEASAEAAADKAAADAKSKDTQPPP